MKFTKTLLRSVRIVNAWDYANGNPFLYYRPQVTGRGYNNAAWCIYWPGHNLSTYWRDDKALAFNVYSRDEKASKFLEAQEKFKKLFKSIELCKTPFGSWMARQFVARRNKEIQEFI